MGFVVTHFLGAGLIGHLYRKYVNQNLPILFVFFVALGGILPDGDFVLNRLLISFEYFYPFLAHGGITHTPFFALIFLVVGFLILLIKRDWAKYVFAVTLGVFIHICIDFFLGGGGIEGLMLFYPFSLGRFYLYPGSDPMEHMFISAVIDGVIFLVWMSYMFFRKNFRNLF